MFNFISTLIPLRNPLNVTELSRRWRRNLFHIQLLKSVYNFQTKFFFHFPWLLSKIKSDPQNGRSRLIVKSKLAGIKFVLYFAQNVKQIRIERGKRERGKCSGLSSMKMTRKMSGKLSSERMQRMRRIICDEKGIIRRKTEENLRFQASFLFWLRKVWKQRENLQEKRKSH